MKGGDAAELLRDAMVKLASGEFDILLIELCCEPDSELAFAAPPRGLALRITKDADLTNKATKRTLHSIIRFAGKCDVKLHVWVSTPCTAGCPWKHINESRGVATGDPQLTDALIEAVIPLCDHVRRAGGIVTWEWPARNALWKRRDVEALMRRLEAHECAVSTAAAGMKFSVKSVDDQDDGYRYLKKKWIIKTSSTQLAGRLAAFNEVPHVSDDKFNGVQGGDR